MLETAPTPDPAPAAAIELSPPALETRGLAKRYGRAAAASRLRRGVPALRAPGREGMTDPPVFDSVLCGIHNGPMGQLAHQQAEWLAGYGRHVDVVPQMLISHGGRAELARRCEGHDLLVVGADVTGVPGGSLPPIPLLVARPLAMGRDVTDRIVVALSGYEGAERTADLARRLAETYGGSLSLLIAPPLDPGARRAAAAGERILTAAFGHAPEVHGELRPPERLVPEEASALRATLLTITAAPDAVSQRLALDIAHRAGCSILIVPAPVASGARFVRAEPVAVWSNG